jgi:hypothetical protein
MGAWVAGQIIVNEFPVPCGCDWTTGWCFELCVASTDAVTWAAITPKLACSVQSAVYLHWSGALYLLIQ